MANKRYYWLKLKEDFYDNDTMQYLESLDNGYAYAYIYTKLCLKSLKNEGMLIRFVGNCLLPYDMKSLSKLLNMPIDTVKNAVEIFLKIGLIEQLDTGALYMCQINEMIGSETDAAGRMRKKRAIERKQKAISVTSLQDSYEEVTENVTTDIDIEKDKDIEIDKESKSSADKSATRSVKHKYGEFGKVKLTDEQYKKMQEQYPNHYQALIKKLDEYKESSGRTYKNDYLVMTKEDSWVKREVMKNQANATFTWDKPVVKRDERSKEDNAKLQELIKGIKGE